MYKTKHIRSQSGCTNCFYLILNTVLEHSWNGAFASISVVWVMSRPLLEAALIKTYSVFDSALQNSYLAFTQNFSFSVFYIDTI